MKESPQAGGDGTSCGYISAADVFRYYLGLPGATPEEEVTKVVSPGRMAAATAMRAFVSVMLRSSSVMAYFLAQLAQKQLESVTFESATEPERVGLMRAVANAVVAIGTLDGARDRASVIEEVSSLPAFSALLKDTPLGSEQSLATDAEDPLQQVVCQKLALTLANKHDGTTSVGTVEQVAAAVQHLSASAVAVGSMMESGVLSLLQFAFQSMKLFNFACLTLNKSSLVMHVTMMPWDPTKALPYLLTLNHSPALHYSAIKPGDNIVGSWAKPELHAVAQTRALLERLMKDRGSAAGVRMSKLERGGGTGSDNGGGNGGGGGGGNGGARRTCTANSCTAPIQSINPHVVFCDMHQEQMERAEAKRKLDAGKSQLQDLRRHAAELQAKADAAQTAAADFQRQLDKSRKKDPVVTFDGKPVARCVKCQSSFEASNPAWTTCQTCYFQLKKPKKDTKRKCIDCEHNVESGNSSHVRCKHCFDKKKNNTGGTGNAGAGTADGGTSGDAHGDQKCATPACKNKTGSNNQLHTHCLACAQARKDALREKGLAGGRTSANPSPAQSRSGSPGRIQGECFNCHKAGHKAVDCRQARGAALGRNGGGHGTKGRGQGRGPGGNQGGGGGGNGGVAGGGGSVTLSAKEVKAFRQLLGAAQRFGVGRA